MSMAVLLRPRVGGLQEAALGDRTQRDPRCNTVDGWLPSFRRCRDERGEVFPVAILFVGVLLTILIGLHVVLVSVARTAVQSAADRGLTAAQGASPAGPDCGTLPTPVGDVTPGGAQACEGVLAAWAAMSASGAMVTPAEPPQVRVDESAGVATAYAFGLVRSPVLGVIRVAARACGPIDAGDIGAPTRADASAC